MYNHPQGWQLVDHNPSMGWMNVCRPQQYDVMTCTNKVSRGKHPEIMKRTKNEYIGELTT